MPKLLDDERYIEEGAEYYDYLPGRKTAMCALAVVFAAAALTIAHCAKPEKEPLQFVEAVPILDHQIS